MGNSVTVHSRECGPPINSALSPNYRFNLFGYTPTNGAARIASVPNVATFQKSERMSGIPAM